MKNGSSKQKPLTGLRPRRPVYPFSAIVGQDEMKLALVLNVIDPRTGGVLIMGHRGTGKSTAVRALADLLPLAWRVRGCLYGCDPDEREELCGDCGARVERGERLARERARVPVVDLPLGATEDRVCGTINIERALTEGVKAYEPGLLARAHRGFLYIDEVNLLEDHLVDLLLDVAVTGRNTVERESISVEHPSRFVLVGSGNPEEGELRPQLLDRFGLHVEVSTTGDLDQRLTVVERREAFDRDPEIFRAEWESEQESLRRRIQRARKNVRDVTIERELLRSVAALCQRLGVDGHRGELTITRAARALAAFEGRRRVTDSDVRRVAAMSLRHRLRRDPLDQTPGGARVEKAVEQTFHEKGAEAEASAARTVVDSEPEDFKGGAGGLSKSGAASSGNGDGARDRRANPEGETRAEHETGTDREARLPEHALDLSPESVQGKSPRPAGSSRRQGRASKTSYNVRRGRYTRASAGTQPGSRLALDATLRATAGHGVTDAEPRLRIRVQEKVAGTSFHNVSKTSSFSVPASALRYKLLKRKTGTLFVFAVDTSGSMALNRIRQAKGALAHLLERSYVRRDRVALVCFRNEKAEVLLPPTQSVARARRILDALPVGGPTPLSSGINASLEIAVRARRQGAERIVLLIFTDGRANVPLKTNGFSGKLERRRVIAEELKQLGAELKSARVGCVVVDTQNDFGAGGEGQAVAAALGSHYVRLPRGGSDREGLAALATTL